MAILTGQEIKNQISNNHIRIGNYDEKRVQPNSYDVTLGDKVSYFNLNDYGIDVNPRAQISNQPLIRYLSNANDAFLKESLDDNTTMYIEYLDSSKANNMHTEDIPEDGYILYPNTLYIMETTESVWSDKYVIEVSGTSSLARLGITVHKTAGYSNIGHEFKWILEVEVTHPVKVYPGMKIGQCYFHTTEGENNLQYSGKYANKQMGETLCGSLNHLDNNG